MMQPSHYTVENMSQYNNKSSEKRAGAHVYLQKCFNIVIFEELQKLEVTTQIYDRYVDEKIYLY